VSSPSTTPGGTPGPTSSTVSSTGAATATSSQSPTALDPFVFPERDTPLEQASAQLQAVWKPYKVTIIPSRHTLEGMPNIVKVRNFTQGRVSDADAQQLLSAEFRDNTFLAWAELNVQLKFEDFLQLPVFATSPLTAALRAGQPVIDPPCDLYPIASGLVALDQQSRTYFDSTFTRKGSPVTAQYALVQTYKGPCDVVTVTPQGARQVLVPIPAGGATAVFPGHLQRDPVLGELWFAEASFLCGTPDTPTAICASAGV